MGRGNYCPKGEVTDQWYIDHDLYLWDDDEHDEDEVDYDLMLDDIDTLMISIRHRFPSFHEIKEWGDNYWGEKYLLENILTSRELSGLFYSKKFPKHTTRADTFLCRRGLLLSSLQ